MTDNDHTKAKENESAASITLAKGSRISMSLSRQQSYLKGAAILSAAVVITKVIGFFYKVPLQNLMGDGNTGIFNAAFNVYSVVLAVATSGIPVALSRLVAAAAEREKPNQVKAYFRVALPLFTAVGLLCMALMLTLSDPIARFIGVPEMALGLRVLSPAVLFACVYSVYRGYVQGFGQMAPTAATQIIEAAGKVAVGIAGTWLLIKRGGSSSAVCAGALAGSTVGIALTVPVMARCKRLLDRDAPLFRNTVDLPESAGRTLLSLLKTTVPIALGASASSVFALVDTKLAYARLQGAAGYTYEQAKALFGVYSKAQTLFNLPSALFMIPITVSIVPAIAACSARRDGSGAKTLMESALRLNNLLALPAGLIMSVAAYPLFNALYFGSNENGAVILSVLGAASYFVCLHIVATSILQSCGYETLALLAVAVGGAVKIAVSWILVGRIGIVGAPVGTLMCYMVSSAMDIIFVLVKTKRRPKLFKVTARPMLCAVTSAAAAWAVNGLLTSAFPALAASRGGMCLAALVTVGSSAAVFVVLAVCFGAVKGSDIRYIPKGEKLAHMLHLQ